MWIDGVRPPAHDMQGRAVGGVPIGIVSIDSHYPLFPGNAMNGSTFAFPVHYRVLRDIRFPDLASVDDRVGDALIEAGRSLVDIGCAAVVGSCGSFANWQSLMSAAMPVPVFMSVMICAPLLARAAGPRGKIGVICGSRQAMTPRVIDEMGMGDLENIVFCEAAALPEFQRILANDRALNGARLQDEIVEAAEAMVAAEPDIRSIILQCNDLSPYAWAIQAAVGRPVFDASALVEWVNYACVRRPYSGPLGPQTPHQRLDWVA